jgi:hypothetical protein
MQKNIQTQNYRCRRTDKHKIIDAEGQTQNYRCRRIDKHKIIDAEGQTNTKL